MVSEILMSKVTQYKAADMIEEEFDFKPIFIYKGFYYMN